jgi:hypothetical protein
MSHAVPGVYGPDQPSTPLDLGDGLRARVDALEQRIAAALALHRECGCASSCDLCTCDGPWPCPTVTALRGDL